MNQIDTLLSFTDLYHTFQQIKRHIYVTGEDRYENDAEHSFQLALTAWYLISTHDLELNLTKVLQYAISHDLVEAYAGDVPAFEQTDEVIKQKEKDEHAALEEMRAKFPEANEIFKCIQSYESQSDPESRFVYALDKMLPMINVYMDGGKFWKVEGASLEFLISIKDSKIAVDDLIAQYFEELKVLLRQNHDDLFPTNPTL